MIMSNIPSVEIGLALVARVVVAGVLSAMIGLEREFRAKEAGLRTHFLVGVGSALFMIVSQYGFADVAEAGNIVLSGLRAADAARVAAQVVSGIGFIGAGAIMVQKHYVRGLTTAAGLWVVAAIGMSCGGGLYLMAIVGTIFALIGLELFRVLMRWVSLRMLEITFKARDPAAVESMVKRVESIGCKVSSYKLAKAGSSGIRVSLSARDRSRFEGLVNLYTRLEGVDGVELESIE